MHIFLLVSMVKRNKYSEKVMTPENQRTIISYFYKQYRKKTNLKLHTVCFNID